MKLSNQELLAGVLKREPRCLARLITLAENRDPRARIIQSELFKHSGQAVVIGVTGAPGAGKSTLVDQLALEWRREGKSVAILAVDPSSPFSGGAILGDRIRMSRTAEDSGVYIRSMASRGALGGLAGAALDAVQILDGAGFDIILVETVGVGQAEVDIVRTANTCLVVLVPGMGDSVQSIKAGILEIADIFVINKADREGADLLQKDLRMLLSLEPHSETSWLPKISRTVAVKGEGIVELRAAIEEHGNWLNSTAQGEARRKSILEQAIKKLASDLLYERMILDKQELIQNLVEKCYKKELDPFEA
ncbi:MAG: methylmalonyl Co-A mutase-associated GTPase MeaB, partial [Bdellovibrionales bacterium]|nr:methylmalonyl Co-A mutase-associated GTPase MeaB [Bdellovibrionales bacterium]